MSRELVIATGNLHKLEEIRAILTLPGLVLVGLSEFSDAPEVVEDRDSFEGNAIKKAEELGAFTGGWTLADTRGLKWTR